MSDSFKIIIDNDPTLDYEVHGSARKVFDYFLLPILNSLPSGFSKLIKGSNKSAAHVIDHRTSHAALETLYSHGKKHVGGIKDKIFRFFWFNLGNPKAVRNRLKLVKRELKEVISEKLNKNEPVQILSIASGSARSIIDTLMAYQIHDGRIISTFLDRSPEALEYSKKLAAGLKAEDLTLRWVLDTANNFPKYYEQGAKPSIIEMVGLLDYFTDNQVKKILTTVYQNMSDEGYLITANINDNPERKFITKVVGWDMIYRSAEDLAKLVIESGFKPDKIKIVYEPMLIHCVLVARK